MAVTLSWLTGELRRRLLLGLPLPAAALGALLARVLESPLPLREAGGVEQATGVLDAWAEAGLIGSVRAALYADLAFAAFWSVWLALLCLWVADQRAGRLRWAGWAFAGIALLAGGLDAAEGLALLSMIGGEPSTGAMLQASVGGIGRDIALGLTGLFVLGGCFALAVLPSRPPGGARSGTPALPEPSALPEAQPAAASSGRAPEP